MKELLIGNTGKLFGSQMKGNFSSVSSCEKLWEFGDKMILKLREIKTTFWQRKCLIPVKLKKYEGGNIE